MSSEQQPENSNNNQSRNADPRLPSATDSGDYEIYDSMNENSTPNSTYLSSYSYHGVPINFTGESYFHHNGNLYHSAGMYFPGALTNPDEDYSDEIERELEEVVKEITKETGIDNQEEEFLYSDDVQTAFSRYENENAQHWKQKNPVSDNPVYDEQDEMLEQMDECMRYMEEVYNDSEEYSVQDESNNLSKILNETKLNPDAVEFCPSNFSSSTSTNQATVNTLSLVASEDVKQNEQKNP